MTATADPAADEPPKKKSKLPLIIGLVLALAGGGGGFMAVRMGLIGGGGDTGHDAAAPEEHAVEALPEVAFVPLDPLIITLAPGGQSTHLKFTAQLEVSPQHQLEVETLKPRIVDVLNGYLRAVETSDLEDPAALMKLRAQMLRRIQVVAGEGRVRDLLIMEFVLN